MKIAFLIQAHAEPQTLCELIQALRAPWADFYIHIDAKTTIEPFALALRGEKRVTLLENRIRVFWGGWSLVQATLNLISAAKESRQPYARYVLLSGACYPTRSNVELRDFLLGTAHEFISARPMPDAEIHKPLERLTKWTFEGGYRERGSKALGIRILNALCRRLPDRSMVEFHEFLPHAGSQWWALTSAAIDHVLDVERKHPKLVQHFKTTKMPDECFFQTLLANSTFYPNMRKSLTFADWSRPDERPCAIDEGHVPLLSNRRALWTDAYGSGPIFFARKFGVRNHHIVKQIEEARHHSAAS